MDMVRFALNWYPHPNVKIQNNIIYTLECGHKRIPDPAHRRL